MGVKVAQKVDHMLLNHPERVRALVSRRELEVGHVAETESKRNPVILEGPIPVVDGDVLLDVFFLETSIGERGKK